MKRLITLGMTVIAVAMVFGATAGTVTVTSVTARQRYPSNGFVDVTVTLQGSAEDLLVTECAFAATNSATKAAIPVVHITRNGVDVGSGNTWTRKFIWDARADVGAVKIDDVALSVGTFEGVQLWENGPYWAMCNVGATKPEECGYYFWWGDTVGYKRDADNNGWISVKDSSSFSFSGGDCPTYGKNNSQLQLAGYIDSTGSLDVKYDAATAYCGMPWRMPTDAEFSALVSNCDTEWTSRNGVSGRLVKGRGAYASKSIFFPAAGYGYDSRLINLNSYGRYWSSTPVSINSVDAGYLQFLSGSFYKGSSFRNDGQTVRPVRGLVNGSKCTNISDDAVTIRFCVDFSIKVVAVTAQQRYPWNGLVDVVVTLQGSAEDVLVIECSFAATNSATKAAIPVEHITRNGDDTGSGNIWTRKFIWDAKVDVGVVKIDDVALSVEAKPIGVQLWEGGPYWAECNVGASRPEECGYYFWWGDTVGYKRNASNDGWESVNDGTGFSFSDGNCPTYGKQNSLLQSAGYIDATGNLAATHDAATAHLGAPWRMPTDAEFTALINNCDTEWASRNGVSGRLVKGRGSYASKNIFLPAAGFGGVSDPVYLGSYGFYWSSTPYSGDSSCAWSQYFFSNYFGRNYYSCRYYGQSVRPVRGFAGSAAEAAFGATTHLSLDCSVGAKIADSTHPLVYDSTWYAGGVTAKITENGQEVISGDEGSYAWTPTTDGVNLLMLNVYNALDEVVGTESVYCLSREDLADLVIPEGTTEIGDYAFAGGQFISVAIPNSVTNIAATAFAGCGNLKTATVQRKDYDLSVFPAGCQIIYDIDYVVTFDLGEHGTRVGGGELEQIVRHGEAAVAPEVEADYGWKSIGWSLDFSCVTEDMTVVAWWESIKHGDSVGDVTWDYLLRDDVAIVDNNGNAAVSGMVEGELVVPATLGGYPVAAIGAGAFRNCSDLTAIVLPQCVTALGEAAFCGCSNLVSVAIPEGVTSIPARAFMGCVALEELAIPAGVTDIGEEAFADCVSLKAVDIPAGVTEIAARTFAGCAALGKVALPEDLVRIDAGAFAGCAALGSVSVPPSVVELGEGSFAACKGLSSASFAGQPPAGIRESGLLDGKTCINGPAETVISPADRTVFATELAVTLSTEWPDGVVRYTLDGTEPTAESPEFEGISVHNKTTVRAATFVDGLRWGEVAEATYGVGKVATPVIASESGDTFYHNDNLVSLSCEAKGVEIRYTLNGGEPTADCALYTAPFAISQTTTVKAKAFGHPDYVDSDTATRQLVRAWEGLATPVISPAGGEYQSEWQEVSITCESEGVTVYYTLDGSRPSAANGLVYKGPFRVYRTQTVKAVATKYDWQDSEIARADFTRANALSEAVNCYGVLAKTAEAHPWTVDAANSHDGVGSARSASVEDGTSYMSLTVKGEGHLTFWWKASCEEEWGGEYYDYGSFKVGGIEQAKICGKTGWLKVSVDIKGTGKNTLKWEYAKDGETDEGEDCIWVDQVVWVPADGNGATLTSGEPVPYAWLEEYGLGADSDFETAANAKTGKRGVLGRELAVWEDYVIGANPTSADSVFRAHIDMSGGKPKIIWSPDLNEGGTKDLRIYRIFGAKTLDGQWFEVKGDEEKYNFFKVSVEMK